MVNKFIIEFLPIFLLFIEKLPTSNETNSWTPVKSEPVCVFVNRTFDSSDSEQPSTIDEEPNKP
jgi:hypothetical protein